VRDAAKRSIAVATSTRGRTAGAFARLGLALIGALCAMLLLGAAGAAAATPSYDPSLSFGPGFSPGHIAVDESTGEIYVIDEAGDAIKRFSSSGALESTIPGSSITAGSFGFSSSACFGLCYTQLAVDNSGTSTQGRVYLASEGRGPFYGNGGTDIAFKSSAESNAFEWETQPGGGVADVCGMAVDSSGIPYEVDYSAGVRPLDPGTGAFAGSALYAAGDTCQLAFDSTGASYVRHYNTNELQKFSSGGAAEATVDPSGALDVAVDTGSGAHSNEVFSAHSGEVKTFSSAGASTGAFGSAQISSAVSVAVDASAGTEGYAYVSDPGSGKILAYDLSGTVHAVEYELDVGVTGDGKVDAASGAISGCRESSGTCSGEYEENSTVTLTATPDEHNQLVEWGGACSGSASTCEVTMSEAKSVTAQFGPTPQKELTVVVKGAGEGGVVDLAVLGGGSGIACGHVLGNTFTTCTFSYDEGSTVELVALAEQHNDFAGWTNCPSETTHLGEPGCDVTMSADTTVEAEFIPTPKHALAVEVHGNGEVSDGAGITCTEAENGGAECEDEQYEGDTVHLTATPGPNTVLGGWTGCTPSGVNQCEVTIGAGPVSVSATFVSSHPLRVVLGGNSEGSVQCDSGSGLGACAPEYEEGSTVTLKATANAENTFAGWLGECEPIVGHLDECEVTLDGPQRVTAVFLAEGATGPQGDPGPTGPQGDPGAQGPQGDPGATGPQGSTGAAGAQGPAGQDGDAGPQGAKGDAGPKGDTGATGAQGPAGKQGPPGMVTCKVKQKGKKVKVTCTVKSNHKRGNRRHHERRLRWRLTRDGRAVRHGLARGARLRLGALPPGRYRLHLQGSRRSTLVVVAPGRQNDDRRA
jgi:Divergent InlB B-repeat domain/Collagen triple helix repeat (20 copies)